MSSKRDLQITAETAPRERVPEDRRWLGRDRRRVRSDGIDHRSAAAAGWPAVHLPPLAYVQLGFSFKKQKAVSADFVGSAFCSARCRRRGNN